MVEIFRGSSPLTALGALSKTNAPRGVFYFYKLNFLENYGAGVLFLLVTPQACGVGDIDLSHRDLSVDRRVLSS